MQATIALSNSQERPGKQSDGGMGGWGGLHSSLQPLIYTCCYARPLQQHNRTVAKTSLHLSVLITNPISDLIFKTMIYTYLRRVWPVEVVLASRPPGFSRLSSKRRGSPNCCIFSKKVVQSRVALTHFIYYKVVGMFRYGN